MRKIPQKELLSPIVTLICESSFPKYGIRETDQVTVLMEDTDSPVTRKYVEKLYESLISKAHVDFGDIPNSKGNIKKYSGYEQLLDVLGTIEHLAKEYDSASVMYAVNTVQTSVQRVEALEPVYEKGFSYANNVVILEYNMIVYSIVQATSALIYSYVDYIKNPKTEACAITLSNSKHKANGLYIDQLVRFNDVTSSTNYRKYLEGMLTKEGDNFIGTYTALGVVTVIGVSLAIVPVLRELVFYSYSLRGKMSDVLAQQAYFLEVNRANLESSNMNPVQKRKVITKQKEVANKLIKLSEKIRVSHVLAQDEGNKLMKKENQMLSLDSIKKEINSSPLELM